MSSDSDRTRGRPRETRRIVELAVTLARRAMERTASDTAETYLANSERQDGIVHLLVRFGEALKALPDGHLDAIGPGLPWKEAMRFRDLAAHWYADGLDQVLIWRVVRLERPPMMEALDRSMDLG